MNPSSFYTDNAVCRARRLLLINGTGIVLFVVSILGLEATAGYLPWPHDVLVRSVYLRMAESLAFWITAMTAVPFSALALRRSGQVDVAVGNTRLWYVRLARLETALWTVIWVIFIGTFWPAITCGLHIYGFPSPISWPHNVWLRWQAAHKAFEQWLAGHMPRG